MCAPLYVNRRRLRHSTIQSHINPVSISYDVVSPSATCRAMLTTTTWLLCRLLCMVQYIAKYALILRTVINFFTFSSSVLIFFSFGVAKFVPYAEGTKKN